MGVLRLRVITIFTYIMIESIFLLSAQNSYPSKIYETEFILIIPPRDSLQYSGNYYSSIKYNEYLLMDSICDAPLYRIAIDYAKLNNFDSAFRYLHHFIDISADDRVILVDQDLLLLKSDSLQWQSIIRRVEENYLQSLDSTVNKTLALRLFYMGILDQIYRTYLPFLGQIDDSLSQKIRNNDEILFAELEQIILKYGFPSISMVGKLANINAFLLIQHSPSIKKTYYKMIERAYLENDFDPVSYAMLTDRWLMQHNKKQMYGTQIYGNIRIWRKYGKSILYPVKRIEEVHHRREKIGFQISIEEYVESLNATIPEKYYKK
jgi:hypothetical protein